MSANAQPTKKLFTYDTVEPQPPSYLWEPYLTENNVNLVFGAGGSGKTMLVCALIAALTSGNHPPEMPGVLPDDPVNAIYFGSEDDAENYSYRLLKCGADRARVFSVPESDMPGLIATGAIREYISEARAKLIVFDPIQAFLPAGADMNSTSEMRPLMNGLREICREMKCTALLVGHTNKNEKAKAANRASGSSDLVNASRSALYVGYHPTKNGIRAAVHVKTNGRMGDAILFSIDESGSFQWGGTEDVNEEAVANAARTKAPRMCETDPVFLLVKYVLQDSNSHTWEGTAAQLLALSGKYPDLMFNIHDRGASRSIGRSLNQISGKLAANGIMMTKSTGATAKYRFYMKNKEE